MGNRKTVLITAILGMMLAGAAAEGQANSDKGKKSTPDTGLVLHLNVRQVPVDVVVLDQQGNVVRGLKKDDFIVKEDGKKQQVLSFDWMDGTKPSTSLPALPSLPPNTFMNAATVPERGPLYVLYFDMVNMEPDDQMAFHNELMKFIDEVQPGTRIALFVNDRHLHLMQGFTTDHVRLREAILRKGPGPHVPKVFIFGENFGQGDVGGALSNLNFMAEYLEGLPGRKNLLWMADNFPIPVTATLVSGTGTATAGAAPRSGSVGAGGGPEVLDLTELERDNVKHTYSALMRSQIALYPIDVSGVTGAIDAYQKWDMIAQATGGRAYYSDNRPHLELEEAVQHGESYYTLSYAPSNAKFDGSERHIEVKLTKHDDEYKLTYRTGYYALSDEGVQQEHKKEPLQARFLAAKEEDNLYANIEHGAPILHDLLFSAHLAADGAPHMASAEEMQALEDSPQYFKTHQKHPQKALPPVKLQKYVIDYGVIDPQLKAAIAHHQKTSPLEFAAAAYDDDGQLLNSILNQGYPSGNGGKDEALYHAIQELEVPPDAAFIRVAVRDTMTNRTGTLEVTLPLKPEAATASAGSGVKGTTAP